VQTLQSHPTMGTPTEVPVPRKVKVRDAMEARFREPIDVLLPCILPLRLL
jgi:hypothetical protein